METMSKDQQSLLMYFETCLVDHYGRLEGQRMNSLDIKIAEAFNKNGLIKFGRLSMEAIQRLRGDPRGTIYTHYVRFTDKAWELAHKFRRERSERMLAKNEKELTA